MNRRSLLRLGGSAAIGVVAARFALSSIVTSDPERLATVNRMIAESGSWWMQVRDRENGRNPAIVYFGDGPAFEISRNSQKQWQIAQRELTQVEQVEFDKYHRKWTRTSRYEGGKPGTRVGDKVWDDADYLIRAWIENGRRPGWNMSIEKATI